MMAIYFGWILFWGLVGYFTVRTILVRREMKRLDKEMAVYLQQRANLLRVARGDKYRVVDFDYMNE